MATTDIVPQEAHGQLGRQRVVNDMSIQVATVNGSGSQSSRFIITNRSRWTTTDQRILMRLFRASWIPVLA